MLIFGGIDHMEALWRSSRSSRRKPHISEATDEDSKTILESTEEHLRHFSKQILNVEETKMAHLKEGLTPRKLNQWLKKGKELEGEVTNALQKQQRSKDPSLACTELKEMRDKIIVYMLECPLKDGNDKTMPLIAKMHETEDGNVSYSISLPGEDGLQAQDGEKVEHYSDIKGKQTINTINQSALVSHLRSYIGIPRISESGMMGGGTEEGESSQVHDAVIPKSTSPYISGLPLRRDGKDPIHETVSDIYASTYPKGGNIPPQLVQEEWSSSYSQGSRHHKRDQILLNGVVPMHVDLRLQILSMSPIHTTLSLNNNFGLHPKMDSYLFSDMKMPAELQPDSQQTLVANSSCSLPETPIVNRRGPKDMPADDEWFQADVVMNLMEKEIRELNQEPHYPNLMILFLQRNSRLTDIHSSFFNHMPVLRFLDLSDSRIKALPSSLFKLTNLQVLLLQRCVCLDSLPPDIKNLRNLEALDLLGTELSHLPEEISELTKLKYLQLSFCQPNSQSLLMWPFAIFKLQALQGLSIDVNPQDQQWIHIVEEVIEQVSKLNMLRYLQFYFPTVQALKSFSEVNLSWREQRFTSFKFLVGHNIKRIISRVPDEVESKYEQYNRCLRFVNSSEAPEKMKSILQHVTAFYLDHHLEIESLSDFDISTFNKLKFCVLRECPNIHIMIKTEKRTKSDFPNLEYLGLHYLWELEQIWEDPIPPRSYQSLKYLMVSTCCKLEFIASHAVLQCLSNLEKFIIEDCESLISIVKDDETEKYDTPLLPKLKELELRHLPQLVVLGRGLFPSKQIISIHFCPKLVLDPVPNRIERKKLGLLPSIKFATSALLAKLGVRRIQVSQTATSSECSRTKLAPDGMNPIVGILFHMLHPRNRRSGESRRL